MIKYATLLKEDSSLLACELYIGAELKNF